MPDLSRLPGELVSLCTCKRCHCDSIRQESLPYNGNDSAVMAHCCVNAPAEIVVIAQRSNPMGEGGARRSGPDTAANCAGARHPR